MLFCRLSGLFLFSLVVEAICMVTRSVSTVSNNEIAVFLKKVLIPCIGNARQYTPGSCDSGKDVEHAYIWLTLRESSSKGKDDHVMILIQASKRTASEICSHLSTSCCWSQESRQECWCREVHLLAVPGKYECRGNYQLEMWDPLPGFSAFWICLHEEFLFKVPFSFFSKLDFFIFYFLLWRTFGLK